MYTDHARSYFIYRDVNKLSKHIGVHSENVFVGIVVLFVDACRCWSYRPYSGCRVSHYTGFPVSLESMRSCASSMLLEPFFFFERSHSSVSLRLLSPDRLFQLFYLHNI
jgi:hypothetical protein